MSNVIYKITIFPFLKDQITQNIKTLKIPYKKIVKRIINEKI